MPNIRFDYMYRDGGNNKNHGEAVFTNRSSLPLDQIKRRVKAALQDGEHFIAWQIKLDELFFETPSGDDHVSTSSTTIPGTSTRGWRSRRPIPPTTRRTG